eukprot:scaffold15945_cov106-Isochrysis_galbana.AAC.3
MAALCGWRVVAIDAFPSGLVTATPPTPLLRRGGGGARTCATQNNTKEHPAGWRGTRKGVGSLGARTEEKASLPPRLFLLPLRRPTPTPRKRRNSLSAYSRCGVRRVGGLARARVRLSIDIIGIVLWGNIRTGGECAPLEQGCERGPRGRVLCECAPLSRRARRRRVGRRTGPGPVSRDVSGVLFSAEDAGEGVAHGGARSSGGEREGVAEGAPTAPRVDVAMTALGASDVGYGYRTGARGPTENSRSRRRVRRRGPGSIGVEIRAPCSP